MWKRYQNSLLWIHEQLALGYGFMNRVPICDNCGWFDFWGINVARCYEDHQILRFAALVHALCDGQPQFLCTAPGCERGSLCGHCAEGGAEWAQNLMGMLVEPIIYVTNRLGSEDTRLLILGNVVKAGAPNDEESLGLRNRLDALLKKGAAATYLQLVPGPWFSACCQSF